MGPMTQVVPLSTTGKSFIEGVVSLMTSVLNLITHGFSPMADSLGFMPRVLSLTTVFLHGLPRVLLLVTCLLGSTTHVRNARAPHRESAPPHPRLCRAESFAFATTPDQSVSAA